MFLSFSVSCCDDDMIGDDDDDDVGDGHAGDGDDDDDDYDDDDDDWRSELMQGYVSEGFILVQPAWMHGGILAVGRPRLPSS